MSFFDKILDFLDRHQLSISVVFIVHIIIFFWIMFTTFEHNVELFEFTPRIKMEEEDPALDLSDLEVPDFRDVDQSFSNITQNVNDERQIGEDWSEFEGDESGENPYLTANDAITNGGDGSGEGNTSSATANPAKETSKDNKSQENQSENANSNAAGKVGGSEFRDDNGVLKWSLKGRSIYKKSREYIPTPFYASRTAGVVYVEIKVNRQGMVIATRIIKSKSNYSSEYLGEQALKYAKRARFNASGSASSSQTGYILYYFKGK